MKWAVGIIERCQRVPAGPGQQVARGKGRRRHTICRGRGRGKWRATGPVVLILGTESYPARYRDCMIDATELPQGRTDGAKGPIPWNAGF